MKPHTITAGPPVVCDSSEYEQLIPWGMLTKPKRNMGGIPVRILIMENETPKFCGARSLKDRSSMVVSRPPHLHQGQITPGSKYVL
jgi:hypothetical protein